MPNDTLRTLARATVAAHDELEAEARPTADVYADLTTLFATHGLNADTAESAVDWFEGGPELLVESLRDALTPARRPFGAAPREHVHVWGTGRPRGCLVDDCDVICGLYDPDEWCHECGGQFAFDDNGTAYHVTVDTAYGIVGDDDGTDHVPYSLPDEEDEEHA